MEIASTPKNYASMFGPLVYTVAGTDPAATTDVEILADEGTLLGAKRFHRVAQVEVDIAPYLRLSVRIEPLEGASGFYPLPQRSSTARIRIGETESPAVTAAASRSDLTPPQLLTALPLRRMIGTDECDEIGVAAPPGSSLTACVTLTGSGTERRERTFTATAGSLSSALVLDMRELAAGCPFVPEGIGVTITVGSQSLATIDYDVVRMPARAVRVAWINRLGAIDRYTFPEPVSRTCSVERQQVDGLRSLPVSERQTLRLRSAYETAQTLEELADVLATPQAWIDRGGTFTPTDILSRQAETLHEGELLALEIEIGMPSHGHLQRF